MAKRDNKSPADLSKEDLAAYKAKIGVEIPDYPSIRVKFESVEDAALLSEDSLERIDPRYSLVGVDDTTVDLVLRDEEIALIRNEAVKKTRQLISGRVEAFGLVDPDVRVAGDSDIVVQIPGVGKGQMEDVRRRIGQTAQLTFRMVDRLATFFADNASAVETYNSSSPERAEAVGIRASTSPAFTLAPGSTESTASVDSR